MEMRHIRYFLAVADALSFSRAAQRLFVSQSSLSRAVKALEEEIGASLLERTTAQVALTPAGEQFREGAERALNDLTETVLDIRRMANSAATRLDVAYIPPALEGFLHEALVAFRHRHPNIEINLYDLPPGRQVRDLEARKLDIGLIGGACPALADSLDLFTICRIPMVLAVHADHPVAHRKSVRLAEMAEERFVGLAEQTFPGRLHMVQSACKKAGFTARFSQSQADSLHTMAAFIQTRGEVALVPSDIESILPRNVVLVTVRSPRCSIAWTAAVQKGEHRASVRFFLQQCREIAHSKASQQG